MTSKKAKSRKIVLTDLQAQKLANLLSQKNAVENQIKELTELLADMHNIPKTAKVTIQEDLKTLLVE